MAFTVESFDAGGKNPTTTPATRALIRDKAGNPLCLVVEYSGGYLVSDVDDDDFPELLKTFGVSAPVVRRRLHAGG